GADNTKGDRTHLIALGGKVKLAKLAIDGNDILISGPEVEVEVKQEITVNVIKLDSQLSDAALLDEMKIVEERYAQVGLKVNLTLTPGDVSGVSGVDLSDGVFIIGS